MSRKKKIIISVILYAVAAVCGIFFLNEYHTAQEEIAEYTLLQGTYTETKIELLDEAAADPQEIHAALPYRYPDWTALQQENPDIIGWLSIPFSPVNYPVVQTTDNYTYLNRSFSGGKSSTGAAFMDAKNNTDPLDQNTLIYAHNMGSGRQDMFGSLLKYKDREYYDMHPYIQFDTVQRRHGWWRIFAVIDHNIKSGDFNYLKLNFADQDEFAAWIAQAKELSLYETGVAVSSDDTVLTLSTCDRSIHGRNGRQLVMAVKIV